MRIDAHQHFWNYLPEEYAWIGDKEEILKKDFLPPDLEPLLLSWDMDGTIAVQARQTDEEMDWLVHLADRFPFIKAVVGWVDLRSPSLTEQLDHWQSFPVVRGFRHMVQDENDPGALLLDEAFNRGVEEVLKRGLVYEILVQESHLEEAAAFCARHEAGPLVLDHLGKPDIEHGSLESWTGKISPLADMSHVTCKLSGLVTEAAWHAWEEAGLLTYMDTALRLFGPDRLMFGSDWPVCKLAASPGEVYRLAEKLSASLSNKDKNALWGGTACRVYGIGHKGENHGFETQG